MAERLFKRKIYSSILQWKQENDGKSALLIEGARRVGKSTIVEEFAKKEYDSYRIRVKTVSYSIRYKTVSYRIRVKTVSYRVVLER